MASIASPTLSGTEREQVLTSLHVVLKSPGFQNAQRARDFLQFIVETALEGNRDLLKERVIGVQIFRRAPDYSTGEDSVVRVQASDVRRRLDRFNQSPEARTLPVLISLPTGTYCPQFQFFEDAVPAEEPSKAVVPATEAVVSPSAPARTLAARVTGHWPKALLLMVTLVLMGASYWLGRRHAEPAVEDSIMVRFWRPLTASGRTILICIPRTASYRFTNDWFATYNREHPHTFDEEWERLNRWPDLTPSTPLRGGDLLQMSDHGVGAGDVYTATALTAGLAKAHIPYQVRIGQDYQYEDIRKLPSVQIGAFNNRWTMQLDDSLPFRFKQIGSRFAVVEAGGEHRTWISQYMDSSGHWVDYGLIARILRSDTGQPVLILAGTGRPATEITGDFVTENSTLERAVAQLPKDWEHKNVLFVLRTRSTDGVADPAQVIASSVW